MNSEMMGFIAGLAPELQEKAFAAFQQKSGQAGLDRQAQIMAGDPRAFEDIEGQRSIIDDQQAQAEQLRGTEMPQGMQTQNAGFVASNPLSHIATIGNRIMGNIDAKKAAEAKSKLSDKITNTQQNVAEIQRQGIFARQQAQAQAVKQNTPMQSMAQTQQRNPSMDM